MSFPSSGVSGMYRNPIQVSHPLVQSSLYKVDCIPSQYIDMYTTNGVKVSTHLLYFRKLRGF